MDGWQQHAARAMDSELICGNYSHQVKGVIMVTIFATHQVNNLRTSLREELQG